MLTQRDIDLIGEIVAAGSVRKASETLGLHAATVYRQIKDLQKRVSSPLFQRLNGHYQPTALALDIADAAYENRDRLALVNRRISGESQDLAGPVRVTTADTLYNIVAEGIASTAAAYPELRITLQLSNRMADLSRHEADVAIRPATAVNGELVGRRAAKFDYRIFGVSEEQQFWIGFTGSLNNIPAGQWLTRNVKENEISVRVDSFLTAAALCRCGLGKAVLPSYLGKDLRPLADAITCLRSDIWVLTHPDLKAAPRIAAFTAHISRHLQVSMRGVTI